MNLTAASVCSVLSRSVFQSFHSAAILLILLGCSVVSLAFILERWLYFRGIRTNPEAVLRGLRESLGAGRREEALRLLGETRRNPVLDVIEAGIESSRHSPARAAQVMRICQTRHRAGLERNLGLLGTLGNVSPFIGLLGTVLGIMQAFQDLAGPQAQVSGAAVVASGIAQALAATAAGLMVAIPAVIFYNHFLRRAKAVCAQMEVAGMELLLLLEGAPAQEERGRHASRS